MEKWTFATSWPAEPDDQFHKSGQVFDDPEGASEAAAEWMAICAHNGFLIIVRLIKLTAEAAP